MRSRALVILIGVVTALSACSPDRASDPNVQALAATAKSPAKSRANYEWMGKFHNEALDFALVKITATKKASKLERCKVGLAAVKEFSREFQKSNGSRLRIDPDVIEGMCEASANDLVASAYLAPTATISPTAQSYMNQIADAVDYAPSTTAYSSIVSQITSAAAGALGDGSLEAGAVYGTGSIGVSSNDYWASNSTSWSESSTPSYVKVDGPTAPSYQVSSRTRRIAKVDIAAAIGVLVRDWWMGELVLEKAAISAAAASLIAALTQT